MIEKFDLSRRDTFTFNFQLNKTPFSAFWCAPKSVIFIIKWRLPLD